MADNVKSKRKATLETTHIDWLVLVQEESMRYKLHKQVKSNTIFFILLIQFEHITHFRNVDLGKLNTFMQVLPGPLKVKPFIYSKIYAVLKYYHMHTIRDIIQ